ncbi:unnamed protein product [Blepharisma stoltei]|uniref:ubiquitinyl hydrolase 1 n=1 Tax=Blepharisma stoltei TaxID=1481888 RepID=A0AAU9JXM5_9CILI|nr:unnamed protein product [Blepharisma stoltei]
MKQARLKPKQGSIRNPKSSVNKEVPLVHKVDFQTSQPIKKHCPQSARSDFQNPLSMQKFPKKADNSLGPPNRIHDQEVIQSNPCFGEASQDGKEFVESSPYSSDASQKSSENSEAGLKMAAFPEIIEEISEIVENNAKPQKLVERKNKSPVAKNAAFKPLNLQKDSKDKEKDSNYEEIHQKEAEIKVENSKFSELSSKTLQLVKKDSKNPDKYQQSLQIRSQHQKILDYVDPSKIPDKIDSIPMTESVEVDNIEDLSKPQIIISIKPLNFEMNSEKYPETVTPYWIPIDEMKQISIYSKSFQRNVEELKNRGFIGWKRSRGDGNCYYRAIMNNYVRLIFEVHRSVHFATRFLTLIENITIDRPGFSERKKIFINIIDYLRRIKALNPIQAFVEFNKFTQDQEFDKLNFEIGRAIAAQTLIDKKDDPLYQPFIFEDLDFLIEEILKHGEEAGDLALMMLPLGLNIQIQIFSFFDRELALTKYPEEFKETAESLPPICVVRRSGHYDILCSNKELDGNMYDFNTGCYSFIIENNKKLQAV